MKKLTALLLAVIMVLTLCACGSKTTAATTTDVGSAPATGSDTSSGSKYAILDEKISSEQYAIGFKKGNTELRDAVQAGLYTLLKNGTVAKVAAEYTKYNLDKMLCLDASKATTFDMTKASADMQARKQLIVGFDANYPPYGFKATDGSYTGFDLELAQAVCDIYGWTLVKQPIDWDAKDMELNSGSIDCIWNGFTITGRENDYTWTDPYVDNSIVVLVMSDSGIKTLADLAGKTVVTQADSSALSSLQGDQKALADTFADLQQTADYNTAFMNLQSGMVDAVAVDIGVAQYYVSGQN
jgi:ABC-type amino acid transport substrate-binding protein